MTTALIATNHLAIDPLLRARLAYLLPGIRVGGFVEYMEFLDQGGETPAVYAYYAGEDVSARTPHQAIVGQTWSVVLVTTPERVNGVADLSAHGGMLATLIAGLSGHILAPSVKPMARQPDQNDMSYGAGMLFSFLAFSTPLEMR